MALEIFKAWIPLILILVIWYLFALFFGRKFNALKAKKQEVIDSPSESITLVRAMDPTNCLSKFSVFIDNVKVGHIAVGEVKNFPISPGSHRIKVKVDFCTSQELQFEKHHGLNQRINCGSTYNDWRCIFMVFLDPRNYVYVRTEAT
jgi:hypothetical protein